MKFVNSFSVFVEQLISENDLDFSEKEKYAFLPYKEYSAEIITNRFIIYEDWWLNNPEIIKSKIKSIFKISERVFARKCKIQKIDKPQADLFLNENHIYGSAKSKIKIGLFYNEELYAVATFAGQRQFHDGTRSVELLRYCSKNGYTVVGGLDKLLKAYIKEYKPNSIMTYVDLDWGVGNSFLKLGFELKEKKESIVFYVNTKTSVRIPENKFSDYENVNNYLKISNKGSLKMIKELPLPFKP